MEVYDEYISPDVFAKFLQKLPQVSVELLVEQDGELLLVRRTNQPAKGEWFVPGARLFKGESFKQAVHRIARDELGIRVDIISQVGTFNHFWEASAFESVSQTHTVNIVYHVQPKEDASINLDEQHSDFCYTDGENIDLLPQIEEYMRAIGVGT